MLLIDGVRYQEWEISNEDELEQMVIEHAPDIFGENSIYFDKKQKLKSLAGVGSIPDGLVIMFGSVPQWHIVEVELSSHQLYDHIVNQVGRFISGVKSTATQKKIIEAIYHYIQENKQIKAEFEEAIGSGEVYKFLADLITKSPVLVIIIEKRTGELDEALDLLKYSPIEVREFQTFRRVGAEVVHAHLFEPLYKRVVPSLPSPSAVVPSAPLTAPSPTALQKVTAGDFEHQGNGVFVYKSNTSIAIDVKKKMRIVRNRLTVQGLEAKRLGSFYWFLRKKVGLLKTPTEE